MGKTLERRAEEYLEALGKHRTEPFDDLQCWFITVAFQAGYRAAQRDQRKQEKGE